MELQQFSELHHIIYEEMKHKINPTKFISLFLSFYCHRGAKLFDSTLFSPLRLKWPAENWEPSCLDAK